MPLLLRFHFQFLSLRIAEFYCALQNDRKAPLGKFGHLPYSLLYEHICMYNFENRSHGSIENAILYTICVSGTTTCAALMVIDSLDYVISPSSSLSLSLYTTTDAHNKYSYYYTVCTEYYTSVGYSDGSDGLAFLLLTAFLVRGRSVLRFAKFYKRRKRT